MIMMMIRYLVQLFLIIKYTSTQPSPHHKNVQLIGSTRYVSLLDEKTRNFCGNFWCSNDAFFLFTKSSQYVGVDPCVDFKNFSVNHVEEVDQPDERFVYRGFKTENFERGAERMRKVVAAKINPDKDTRIVKVMKNGFQKCLQSPHLFRHLQAHKDIIKHLQSLGGSPYLSKHTHFNPFLFNARTDYFYNEKFGFTPNNVSDEDALWSGNDFIIERLFEVEPWNSLSIFFGLEVKRCEGSELMCIVQFDSKEHALYYEDENFSLETFKEFFNSLEDSFRMPRYYKMFLIDEIYKPTLARKQSYLKARDEIRENFKNSSRLVKISIKHLRKTLATQLDIDWLKIINSQLLKHSKVKENDEILVELELLRELVRNLIKTDKKTIADTFVSIVMYRNRHVLALRFYNKEIEIEGAKKGFQRWQRCLILYMYTMTPAYTVMYEQWRPIWDRSVGDINRDITNERLDIPSSIKNFTQEAVDEFKKQFKLNTNLKPSIAIDVLNKLNNIIIVPSLQMKYFPVEKLDEFYDELNLKGDEKFLETVWETQRNHRKIVNEPLESWRRQVDHISSLKHIERMTYYVEDGNILYISPILIAYPMFHPLRPRFFNMATIFTEVIDRINEGVQEYVKKKFNLSPSNFTTGNEDSVIVAYNHYSNWLRNHKDMIIGANLLTHRQLFWVAFSVVSYARFHKKVSKATDERQHFMNEYYKIVFRQYKEFNDDFQCNTTADELKKLKEAKKHLDQIKSKILDLAFQIQVHST